MTDTLRAGVWMIGAIVSFSSMAVAGREAATSLDTFEILFYRSVIGVVVVVAVAAAMGRLAEIRARRMGLHAARNLAHFGGQNLWLYAVATAPLAQVFALEFTTPIWALLLAPLILGERITRQGLVAALFGFAGVLIVARPGLTEITPGLAAAAGCAIGFGLTALFTRRLTRTESVTAILFWLTVMQTGFGLAFAAADGDLALPPAEALPWVAIIALAGLLAHLCLTMALSLAPAAVVMPVDFVRLPVIALVGMALYGEALDLLVFVGGAVIVAANWINLRPRKSPPVAAGPGIANL